MKLDSQPQVPAELKVQLPQNFPSGLCGLSLWQCKYVSFLPDPLHHLGELQENPNQHGSVLVWSTMHRNQEVSTWNSLTNHKGTFTPCFILSCTTEKTTNVKCTKRYSTKRWSTEQPCFLCDSQMSERALKHWLSS